MSNNSGGPAFPSHGTMGEVVCEGMTLRDYFAAKAMQAMLVGDAEMFGPAGRLVKNAFAIADSMLAERAK